MSQENVEIVRRAYAAFSEGNLGPVLDALDADLEWNASDVFFDQPRTYHDRQTWQEQFLPELAEIFEEYRVVREQFEATNRGEFSRPMADWADEVELVAEEGTNAGTYSGRDVVGDWFGDWFRMFRGGVHFDLRKIRDSGDAVAVAADH